jgi:hypothetical protein
MDLPLCQESSIPWSKVSSKRGCPQQEDSTHDAKHSKEDNHWLHSTTTKNCFSALTTEETSETLQSDTAGVNPKPPPIFISDVIIPPPLYNCCCFLFFNNTKIKPLLTTKLEYNPKFLMHIEQ